MTARCIMMLGTTSGAGKSWLTTALCRYYARQGLKVAPFKAQNMSNNARVVASSNGQGEIGSAQYFQALAAKAEPEVRMNPLLLKPEADTHSQVVLLGQVSAELTAMPWRERSNHVWPQIAAALDALRAENDVVVIEGAGSPAEINLHASDIVNMRVALHCNAACLLVTDIDRGGAFAHLYGTWALLPEDERALITGFVLNKFRGDAALLAPAPQMLQDLTGIPTVATLPMWWQHGLPEEDGVFDMTPTFGTGVSSLPPGGALAPSGGRAALGDSSITQGEVKLTVAVVAYPRISNLDEFQPLKNIPGVRLLWARSPAELAGLQPTDWIILPGSKATTADLTWLRTQGLDAAVAQHAQQGGAVLGVCGGLQMLGEALIDPSDINGNAPGLGLLPLVTLFAADKTVQHTQTRFASRPTRAVADASGAVAGGRFLHVRQHEASGHSSAGVNEAAEGSAAPWASMAGVPVSGYEIHQGQTTQHSAMAKAGDVAVAVLPDGLGWQNARGNVLGIYLHGLFEDPAALQALFGARLQGEVPTLDAVFERMADFVALHFDAGVLDRLVR
ncbi:cobyric acid synthase [Rhodoferax sp.]|uniref:cobyric acid synthase n=1 Tax=Rhodoferax sp. TaxID=50421 RepID=UPI002624A494|nr:cobyric acid synthase [Rhodoferax sp.]MDD2808812.1 cobyric acid synthase [Rhodoferax sp.]MDD4944186.1 cobyric acid synthase [Rhodoferax sp.]